MGGWFGVFLLLTQSLKYIYLLYKQLMLSFFVEKFSSGAWAPYFGDFLVTPNWEETLG